MPEHPAEQAPSKAGGRQGWLSPGVAGIGAASFLADVGHEVPALGLHVVCNIAATLVSVPAGRIGDRRGSRMVLATGIALFGAAYAGSALGGSSVIALAPAFLFAGFAIGCVETSQSAVAPRALRGSAFGVFAGIQSLGNLAASAFAGLLWTAISPTAAFAYLAGWMVIALVALFGAVPRTR